MTPAAMGTTLSKLGLDALGLGGSPVTAAVGGMTYSTPAAAPVLDATQTAEYRKAQAAIAAGRGDDPTRSGSLWQSMLKTGPSARQTAAGMEQQQQAFEADLRQRQPQIPLPSEQRILRETNRYNPRAAAR